MFELKAEERALSVAGKKTAAKEQELVQCVRIIGGMSKDDRTDAVSRFMTDPAVKIIMVRCRFPAAPRFPLRRLVLACESSVSLCRGAGQVSIGEGAAGLTLTAANHVFLLEPCR